MSYYVRQQINKKGDTVYKIEVRYFDIVEKKQKSKTKLFIPPKNLKGNKIELLLDKEGKNFEETVMSIVNSNNPSSIKDMRSSFKEFAIRWLDNVKKEKGVTYYEDNVNQVRYLIEELGNYKLTDISPAIIQDLFNRIDSRKKVSITICAKDNIKEILEKRGITRKTIIDSEMPIRSYYSIISGENISEERAKGFAALLKIPFKELFTIKKNEKSYAHQTNLQYKKVLALILGKAVKYGLVERNYATHEFIDFPSATKTKIDVMNEEEIRIFYDTITHLDNMDMKTALMLFLLSGFRRGEVCALKWSDIDFKNQTISISRSARKTKELGLIIKSPKTESSVRKITVPLTLINQLIEYKKYGFMSRGQVANMKKYTCFLNIFTL